ncbi:MAG: dihydroneopterin aldolase [Legionellales bacterium]|nr:dihydroneopterin aldolase [Legionellales bacterium]|tara:strand:+ start:19054 stop:19416 length:363 start_codon:yes stop_codon:yes gene_type:complete
MDSIHISGLRVDTIIGVLPWERQCPQTVILDLELPCDAALAAQDDDLDKTTNYADIATITSTFIRESEFKLIETLADKTARFIQDSFNMPWVKLRVAKPGAIKAGTVSVSVSRGEVADEC